MTDDPRIAEAKAIPPESMVARLGIARLLRTGAEMVGPCPLCGGRDRFGINLRTGAFLCRKCDIAGGDGIALVRAVLGLGFREALDWICGAAPAAIDPAEMARRRARAEAEERRQADAAERYRAQAVRDARAIWDRAVPLQAGDMVCAYLDRRGIGGVTQAALSPVLRFLRDHPHVRKIDGQLQTVHRGPCMIGAIVAPSGKLTAVHQTWLDLSQPKGKAVIAGGDLPSKMVRGAKKGGAIRLIAPPRAAVMVMGEGIETTLSAHVAGAVDGAAYWAGVDLGNMAGRAARIEGRRWHGMPDMDDAEAFVPPPWVRRLIYLLDGDSDPRTTRHKLECGARRAMARVPGLVASIAVAAPGQDFNDMLMGAP